MNSQRQSPLRCAAGFGLVAIALVAVGGCAKPKAVVTGKVKLANGQLVTAGTVSFWGSDNRVGSSPITGDGSYSVPDAPVGEVKITIITPPPRMGGGMAQGPGGLAGGMPADKVPEGMKGDAPQAQNVVYINDRYKELETTTLTWTVEQTKEPQQHDIILDP